MLSSLSFIVADHVVDAFTSDLALRLKPASTSIDRDYGPQVGPTHFLKCSCGSVSINHTPETVRSSANFLVYKIWGSSLLARWNLGGWSCVLDQL